jgi:hypothetical protein
MAISGTGIMAKWRAEALERLPELREQIESAAEIMAFWIEASLAFQRAYECQPPDESLISRVYAFADWCKTAPRLQHPGRDPSTAVMLAFYEHIPTIAAARREMPKWFTYDEVAGNKPVFAYYIGDTEYQRLLRDMSSRRDLYQPRKSVQYDR